MLLGVLRLQQGDPAEAAALLERALAINPSDPAAQTQFGMALIEAAADADAFDRALAPAPGMARYWPRRGRCGLWDAPLKRWPITRRHCRVTPAMPTPGMAAARCCAA